ncbi:MAG: M56 family metallopeptidase [Planctomycetota bacterium]
MNGHWLFGIALEIAAIALTYLVYSTLSMLLVLGVVKRKYIAEPLSRLRLIRAGLLIPILLAVTSRWIHASPWLVMELGSTGSFVSEDSTTPSDAHTDAEQFAGPAADAVDRVDADRSIRVTEIDRDGAKTGSLSSIPAIGNPVIERAALAALIVWTIAAVFGVVRIYRDASRLRRLIALSRPVTDTRLLDLLEQISRSAQCSAIVRILQSEWIDSPFATGTLCPAIILPQSWFGALSSGSQRAILAHEMAHLAGRDPAWNLVSQTVLRTLFFQPLNRIAVRRMRDDAEYAADQFAARLIASPDEVAWSLMDAAEQQQKQPCDRLLVNPPGLAASISAVDSCLQQRVFELLSRADRPSPSELTFAGSAAIVVVVSALILFAVPRFESQAHPGHKTLLKEPEMRTAVAQAGLIAGLFLNPIHSAHTSGMIHADETRSESPTADGSVDSIPDELKDFRGMLIGQLLDRDIERGTFTVKVDYVARVWENNKARNPRSAVGHTLRVDGVTGKWIDQLLLIKPGETMEFEAQHRGGKTLTFPGEWLKKVAPFRAEDHPVPPEGFRGFAGVIVGNVERKHTESRELIVRVKSVPETFERNRAKQADEVVGKQIVLAGFWAKMSAPFEALQVGDTIRAGVLHRVAQSDHLTVAEFAERVSDHSQKGSAEKTASPPEESDGRDMEFPEGMRGFRGILRGRLMSSDIEKGEFVFRAERVTRTWEQNRAADTESCRGRQFVVKRITGSWLDVLVTLKPDDNIEVEAFHNGGEHLDFVSEWLKKVE